MCMMNDKAEQLLTRQYSPPSPPEPRAIQISILQPGIESRGYWGVY